MKIVQRSRPVNLTPVTALIKADIFAQPVYLVPEDDSVKNSWSRHRRAACESASKLDPSGFLRNLLIHR